MLAAPDRLRLLGAKLISHAVMGALLSLIVTVMIMLLVTIILSLRNKTTLDVAALLDVLWRNLTVAAYLGAIGVCLGALLRNQVAAIVCTVLCWIVETTLLGQVPQVGRFAPLIAAPAALVRYDPTDAEGFPGGDDALEPAIALLVMLGWLAALYAIAGVLLRRRHLTKLLQDAGCLCSPTRATDGLAHTGRSSPRTPGHAACRRPTGPPR